MSNTVNNRERGAILATALIGILIIATLLTAGFAYAGSIANRNTIKRAALSRYRTVYSSKLMLQQAVLDGIQSGGNFSNVGAKTSAALSHLGDSVWTASLSNLSIPAFTLGDRSAAFGASDGALMQLSGRVARSRINFVTATLSLSGKPDGTDTVNLSIPLTAAVVEVPATEVQFIASDSAFVQSASTNFTINGVALFNKGVSTQSPMGLRFDGAVSSYGIYFGSTNIPSPTNASYAYAPLGNTYGFTRAINGYSNLIVSPSAPVNPAMAGNQALSLAPANYYHVVWNDPSTAPSNLPPGITFQSVQGSNRIVIDLAAYYGYQNVHIDCGTNTQANGIVVLGSPGGGTFNATPLCITTTGNLMLLGSNARPVITGTNYGLSLGANTANPSTAASASVSWTGYICLAVPSPTIAATCTWGSFSFNIAGTFAFPGGTLNNLAVPMAVQASPATALALASGNVLPDRLFLCEIR